MIKKQSRIFSEDRQAAKIPQNHEKRGEGRTRLHECPGTVQPIET